MSRFRALRSRDFWNPLTRTGGYVLPHIIMLLLVAAILFGVGFFSGWRARKAYDQKYFANTYSFPGLCLRHVLGHCVQSVPNRGVQAPVSYTVRTVPSQGTVSIARYPTVGDQGPIGSCAAWASAWDLSYEWRLMHPTSTLRFSPRCMYDHYSNTYAQGQDGGSWPDQDLEMVGQAGGVRFKYVPYGVVQNGREAYAIDHPDPVECTVYGAPYKINLRITPLTGYSEGAGQAAVDLTRQTISGAGTIDHKPHAVLIALSVYPQYDNATQQPNITSPTPGQVSRGGHENVILGYDDLRLFPDGTVGGVLLQNQWSSRWGIGGRAWLSYDYLRRYSFGLEYISINTTLTPPTTGSPPRFLPNTAPPRRSPWVVRPPAPGVPVPGAYAWHVKSVPGYTRSGGVTNLAKIINKWGDAYHVWPVAIAATVYTESSGQIYAYRWIEPFDKSCGPMQQIVANVRIYVGIASEQAACQWEYNPDNSIWLGTKMLAECATYHNNRVPWPYQYVFYNGGCGLSDQTAMYPYGDYYLHFQGFLHNYNYALAYFAGEPTRPTFPRQKWGTQPYLEHGHLTWAASEWWAHYMSLGQKRRGDRFYGTSKTGYNVYKFRYGKLLCWPGYQRCKVVRA